jgi:hypothetical protein
MDHLLVGSFRFLPKSEANLCFALKPFLCEAMRDDAFICLSELFYKGLWRSKDANGHAPN